MWSPLSQKICLEFIKEWLREGYTNLHFGAVQVVLSSHVQHGLPAAVKMALLNSSFIGDPLLITAKPEDTPTITKIPKQITKDELQKLIPLNWFTNYENLHKASRTLVTMDPTFQTMLDGTIKTSIQELENGIRPSSIAFHTLMTTPASKRYNPNLDKDIPVSQFYPDGLVAHMGKINGHFIWDVDPSMCDPRCDYHLDSDSDGDDDDY
ncbi:hypothetical protein FNV43_RR10316 [Rhamnella rubrinervis]|uniref:Uncharacterized protein n=1 Tax=Rhamnella rubrinervis TaxID=2594499 RepID=A0A8K0MKR8_9ROSA|nr:hypothetical protein FNV43_RR10316 [Rhamnella rubrinervis]